MIPSEALLTKLQERGDAGFVHRELTRYAVIQHKLLAVAQRRRSEDERHEKALEQIDKAKREIVNTCDHPDSKFHGDPSGGSDSFWTCEICGSEV